MDGHPEAIVDLAAVRSNVAAMAQHVKDAQVMAVVKSDGYGHGMIPTAQAATQEPCHMARMTWPCFVTGGSMPCLVNAVDLQPVVRTARPVSATARGAKRRSRPALPS